MKKNTTNKTTKKLQLSISLLVSNRKDTIRKCMESIKPLLEQLPSELIVVDTGSTDGSIDIVKEYTDNIVPFTWCNDFSAARNAGLKKATGEWFLYLDDDEWFEDVTDIIQFFKTGEYKKYNSAYYIQRNYGDMEGKSYNEGYVGRMVKILPETCFKYKVHEWLSPFFAELKIFSSYVHHYGYVFKNEEASKKHSERNIPLIESVLQEYPDDLRMHAQLIQEYKGIENYAKAKELCEEALQKYKNEYENTFIQYMIVCLARMARMGNDLEEAEKQIKELQERYPMMPLTKLIYAIEATMLAARMKKFPQVLTHLEVYFKLQNEYERLENHVKAYYEVLDLLTYTTEKMKQIMLELGQKAMLQSKQCTIAEELFAKVKWSELYTLFENKRKDWLRTLFMAYGETGKAENFYSYLGQLLELPLFREEVEEAIGEFLFEYPARRTEFIERIEDFHQNTPYFLLFHAEYCLHTQQEDEIRNAVKQYFSVSKGKYDTAMVAMFLNEPDYITEVLKQTDIETFKEGVAFRLSNQSDFSTESVDDYLNQMEKVCKAEFEIFFLYLNMILREEKLLKQESDVANALTEYTETVLEYVNAYFSGLLLQQDNWCMLPRNCQFAFWMKQAFMYKKEDNIVDWKECMKQAAEIYPPMIPVIQIVLEEDLKEQQKKMISPELQQLAVELKKNIRELIAAGQKAAAKELVLGLEQYVPQDEDLKELKEKVAVL